MPCRALAGGGQHHAAFVGRAQGIQQGLVVRGAGATAVALQHQAAHAAAEQCFHMAGGETREQRQHGQVHRLARGTVVETGRDGRGAFALAQARQHGKGIEGLRAQFAGTGTVQQLAVEEQMHARHHALAQGLDGAAQVGPGITALGTCRQHGAGQHHRHRQAEQQEAQCRRAVGQGVGAVQQQHAVMTARHRLDYRIAHGQPVRLAHVGAVDQR
ncbi:hypothetical protein D3C84_788840 [compost metagenome]